jgi:hypothetical protein
MGWK